jgi:hypothetical protein
MYCDFKVGDEVICIDNSVMNSANGAYDWLVVGQKYTISRIGLSEKTPLLGPLVDLVELEDIRLQFNLPLYSWLVRRFRKVLKTDMKTDISMLKKLLAPVPKEPVRRVKEKV